MDIDLDWEARIAVKMMAFQSSLERFDPDSTVLTTSIRLDDGSILRLPHKTMSATWQDRIQAIASIKTPKKHMRPARIRLMIQADGWVEANGILMNPPWMVWADPCDQPIERIARMLDVHPNALRDLRENR